MLSRAFLVAAGCVALAFLVVASCVALAGALGGCASQPGNRPPPVEYAK